MKNIIKNLPMYKILIFMNEFINIMNTVFYECFHIFYECFHTYYYFIRIINEKQYSRNYNFEKLKAFLYSASLIHKKLLTLIYINWCYFCIKDNFTHLGNTVSAIEICKYMKNGPSLFFMYKETSNFQLALWGTEAKIFLWLALLEIYNTDFYL